MTHWHDAGFGTDPDGDAARRAEQGVVELPGGTTVALGNLPALTSPEPEPVPTPEQLAEHEVQTGEVSGVGFARCACGAWEAVVTGPASARWAFDQYREHLRRLGLDRPAPTPPG